MKVGVIGTGMVGATAAYAMLMRGVGREIVLIDRDRERAEAEANDILHAAPFTYDIDVYAGDYANLEGARVVVITAGVAQKPGETRLQLLEKNAAILKEIIANIYAVAPEAILVMTTNPVDVMTHIAAGYAGEYGVPSTRIIGSGTTLDTARFRALLGREIEIDPGHIHAYVVGEHGDSEVLAWSAVTVGGLPLDDFCDQHRLDICGDRRLEIDRMVRNAAYEIIHGKGATYYGIGAALSRIVNVILRDQRAILTVCTPLEDIEGVKDVTISIPQLLGGQGILDTFPPVLDQAEHQALRSSVLVIKDAITSYEEHQQHG
ncbi:MAG: L-lactate dehydrogenase [Anaerolineales bacterium]|jgi:L-lactate dehydrogenase